MISKKDINSLIIKHIEKRFEVYHINSPDASYTPPSFKPWSNYSSRIFHFRYTGADAVFTATNHWKEIEDFIYNYFNTKCVVEVWY